MRFFLWHYAAVSHKERQTPQGRTQKMTERREETKTNGKLDNFNILLLRN